METSGKKILGTDWIKRLARRFTPEQFRQQYLAKPLAQQRMEEQTTRRTDAGDRDLLKRKPVTWWVSFSYTYECLDGNGEWDSDSGCDACRFLCREEEIEKKVTEYVKEELDYDNGGIRNIKVEIEDHYITTDYEV